VGRSRFRRWTSPRVGSPASPRLRPWAPASVRGRLILSVTAVVLVTVAAAFAVAYREATSRFNAQLDTSIRDEAIQLARAVTVERDGSAQAVLATARTYASNQPFGQSSAVLFLVIPGVGTASNHPELFGSVLTDNHETGKQQALENAEGRGLSTPHLGYHTTVAPDAGPLRTYQIAIKVAGHKAYAGAGQSLNNVDQAEDGVLKSFILGGVLAIVLAILAALLIGARISAPMRRIAGVAARIDAGELTPRMDLPPTAGRELRVLADAFNHMLDRLEHAFSTQRGFVADASHELRTPLTVIRGQLDLLVAEEAVDPEEIRRVERLIQAEISRLTRLVDDLLVLAQSDRQDFLHVTEVPLQEFITDLWDGLSLTAERNFEVGELPAIAVAADPDRLAQALRNLARNAISHTEAPDGLVRIDAELMIGTEATVRIAVSDNGPGIPPAQRELVFERFHRTDPARSRAGGGAGLGLAIVKAIVEAHEGTVHVVERRGGGARFEIDLPWPAQLAPGR